MVTEMGRPSRQEKKKYIIAHLYHQIEYELK